MDNIGSTLFYIVVMVAVLIGAYLTTRYFSGKSRRMMKSKHIYVLDHMALAKDKSLYLAKVGDKYILIGVTNQSINTLSEIEKESLGDLNEVPQNADQKSMLSKLVSFVSNAKSAPSDLRKARMSTQQEKRGTSRPQPEDSDEEDILERMSRSIEQRKNKAGGSGGGNGENK